MIQSIERIDIFLNLLPLAINISAVWNKVWPILMAILFFGLIIGIHELGHFLTAKLFKVKVNEFALGMGPATVSYTHLTLPTNVNV